MELNKQLLMIDSRCKNADCVSITEWVKLRARYHLVWSCSRRFLRVSTVLACCDRTEFHSISDSFETLLHRKRIKSNSVFVRCIFNICVYDLKKESKIHITNIFLKWMLLGSIADPIQRFSTLKSCRYNHNHTTTS